MKAKDRKEFNELLREHFIPYMKDNKDYLKANQRDMFTVWTFFFTPEITVELASNP